MAYLCLRAHRRRQRQALLSRAGARITALLYLVGVVAMVELFSTMDRARMVLRVLALLGKGE